METEPIAVALKFGFLAVLYLFLFWVARSALKELRATGAPAPEATGFHPVGPGGRAAATDASLVAVTGGGLTPGERFDLFGGLSIGRSADADVRIEDRFASEIHAASTRAGPLLRRGHELHQRHLPERRPARGEAELPTSTRSGSATPSSASSSRCPERLMPLRVAEQALRTDTGRQRTATRTPTSRARRCSRSPTAWAARRPARSPRGSPPSRSSRPSAATRRPRRTCARSPRPPTSASTSSPSSDSSRSGMGTTLTAAMVDGDEVSFAHVGDSRAYLFRDGELRLLTSDHSLVEELRRQGRLTDEQAEEHPQRSIITRALGPGAGGRGRHDDLPGAPRRRVPALLRRADDDGQGATDRARSSERAESLDEAVASADRRGERGAAAATTSPSSPSGSRRRGRGADERARP